MPGPPPKRSEHRRRRNKPADGMEISRAESGGKVDPPSASKTWHPLVKDWFNSLKTSGQCAFYEASDWATAKLMAEILSAELETGSPRASIIAEFNQVASVLLTTEGARRRMRVELSAPDKQRGPDMKNVAIMANYRSMLSS